MPEVTCEVCGTRTAEYWNAYNELDLTVHVCFPCANDAISRCLGCGHEHLIEVLDDDRLCRDCPGSYLRCAATSPDGAPCHEMVQLTMHELEQGVTGVDCGAHWLV